MASKFSMSKSTRRIKSSAVSLENERRTDGEREVGLLFWSEPPPKKLHVMDGMQGKCTMTYLGSSESTPDGIFVAKPVESCLGF